jgi:hypothetical protein
MAIGDRWVSCGFSCGQFFISAGSVIEQIGNAIYQVVRAVDAAPLGFVMPPGWWPDAGSPRPANNGAPLQTIVYTGP